MAAHFGRLRKGATTTAVAAVAVAALSASQAPGVTTDNLGRQAAGAQPSADANTGGEGGGATGDSPYYTDLPPLKSPNPSPSASPATGTPVSVGEAEAGIPATVLDAYKKAEAELRASKPGCNLPWQLLAAIGKVESGQARGGRVDASGTTYSPILGPKLDGNGFALIADTDNGAYDGDPAYDRAVGPMQFIPSTWEWAGRDGNGDGKKDPNNVYDAALAAGHYLCRFDRDLSVQSQMNAAILNYNNSTAYLNTVLSWLEYYRKGTHEVPDGTGTLPSNSSDSHPGASPSPSTPPTSTPSMPSTPSTPGTSKPGTPKPGSGGSTSPTPKPPAPSSPAPSPTPPTPTQTVDHLEDANTGKLTATAGSAFGAKVAVRAESKASKGVAKVRVRFTIIGDTDATFTGGESVATVVTGSTGTATAPALVAGEKTGDFTVRATVVGRVLGGLDYTATVTPRQADTLTRTSDTALTCVPGGEFADQVEVKATYKGAVAGKVADGVLKLPKLYADDATGTFLLRVNTTGGAVLTVELKVAAAAS
jgi:membrane-bound lytic murein transglycosylase B